MFTARLFEHVGSGKTSQVVLRVSHRSQFNELYEVILLATTLFCLLTHLWISYSNSSILRPLPRSKASITLAKRPVGSLLASSGSLGKYVQFRTVWQVVAASCWLLLAG